MLPHHFCKYGYFFPCEISGWGAIILGAWMYWQGCLGILGLTILVTAISVLLISIVALFWGVPFPSPHLLDLLIFNGSSKQRRVLPLFGMHFHPYSTSQSSEHPISRVLIAIVTSLPFVYLAVPTHSLTRRSLANVTGAVPAAFYLACRRAAIIRCYVAIITYLILLQDISAGIEHTQPIPYLAL